MLIFTAATNTANQGKRINYFGWLKFLNPKKTTVWSPTLFISMLMKRTINQYDTLFTGLLYGLIHDYFEDNVTHKDSVPCATLVIITYSL